MQPLPDRSHFSKLLLSALIFVFGLQSMRFLFGSLTWYLRDTLGIAVLDLVPISIAPFLLAALIPISSRWLGTRRSLWLGVVLLVLSRVLLQVSGSPAVDFWAASFGTMAFVGLLSISYSLGRVGLVGGLLLGIAIDSAIKGLGLSLDLAYQPGLWALLAVVALSLGIVWALLQISDVDGTGTTWARGAMLLSIAPFLFAEALILQSQGWTSQITGISGATAQLRISLLNILALYLAYRWEGRRWLYLVSVVVVSVAVFTAEGNPLIFNALSLAAVPLTGVLWAGLVPEKAGSGLVQSSFYLVSGMTLFLILGLAYYLPLDMSLGFSQENVRVFVAFLLLAWGMAGFFQIEPATSAGRSDWVFAAAASALSSVAFFAVLFADNGTALSETTGPVRVMTYNLHSAYNTDGVMDVEAIAEVVEESGAEIVAFQEMPRGRLISSTTDLMTLLKIRLGFDHVAYFGTTDPVWGNAVFSRFPITGFGTDYLPLVGTPMQRGYLGATITVGDRSVLVISTHLQHINDSDFHEVDPEADLLPVHREQIQAIIDKWGGIMPAVLMGDFNARPDWAQIDMIKAAGFVDTWSEVGSGDGFTSASLDPRYRIDYIFHTGGLVAKDAFVISSTASDHLPVVADLGLDLP